MSEPLPTTQSGVTVATPPAVVTTAPAPSATASSASPAAVPAKAKRANRLRKGKGASAKGTPVATPPPAASPTPKGASKQSTIPKGPPKDFAYLEMLKLVKTFRPLTIDGVPLEAIKATLPAHLSALRADQLVTAITYTFLLKPSDPDFLFDMDMLHFRLTVPQLYQTKRRTVATNLKKPRIHVLNEDIPRGYAINVERGFSTIADLAMLPRGQQPDTTLELVAGKGLVSMVKTLDRYLEAFLSAEKAETIKIVRFKKLAVAPQEPHPSERKKPSKQTLMTVEARPLRLEVSLEVASHRQRLVDHFLTRCVGDKSVRLFKETEMESVYLLRTPAMVIPHPDVVAARDPLVPSNPHPPYQWGEGVAVKIVVPYNFGMVGLALRFDRSAITLLSKVLPSGLSVKEITALTARTTQETLALQRAALNGETNFASYAEEAKDRSITEQINHLVTNLGWFCAEKERFVEWATLLKEIASQG